MSFNNRAKGMAFYNLWRNLVLLINNYVPPVAIASVGWKFFILYIVVDALGAGKFKNMNKNTIDELMII